MEYPKNKTTDSDSVLNVEEPTLCAYSSGAGSGSAVLDDFRVYVDVDIDDDEAFYDELDRLDAIMREYGIKWPTPPPMPTIPDDPEEFRAMFEQSHADVLAGRTYSGEEVDRRIKQRMLNRSRQAIINGLL